MKNQFDWTKLPRYLVRRFKDAIGPHCLMIVKEHHGERYFHIDSEKALGEAMLGIVKYWVNYYIYKPEGKEPEQPSVTLEKASELPDKFRNQVEDEWYDYNRKINDMKQVQTIWDLTQTAIKKKDYNTALIVVSTIAAHGNDPGISLTTMEHYE